MINELKEIYKRSQAERELKKQSQMDELLDILRSCVSNGSYDYEASLEEDLPLWDPNDAVDFLEGLGLSVIVFDNDVHLEISGWAEE